MSPGYVTSSRVDYAAGLGVAPATRAGRGMTGRQVRLRRFAAILGALAGAIAIWPVASRAQRPEPTPEPNFAGNILPRPRAYEGDDPYERKLYEIEGGKGPSYERYPGACQR